MSDAHMLAPASQLAMNYGDHRFSYIDESQASSASEIPDIQRYATFKDGIRRIDYVLAYQVEDPDKESPPNSDDEDLAVRYKVFDREPKNARRRRMYEQNLKRKGLELEYAGGLFCEKTNFILVHIPFDLLCKEAEKLGIEMRVRADLRPERTVVDSPIDRLMQQVGWFTFDDETQKFLRTPRNQYHPFTVDDMECFVGHNDPKNFFSSADRIYATHDILSRTRFGRGDRIGIENALKRNVYAAAYPLHEYLDYENLRDGLFKKEVVRTAEEMTRFSTRQFLYWLWAKLRYCHKFQPFYLIKEYFGSKIAMYFVLQGYYTKFLIPCAVVGGLCFIYSFSTVVSDIPSNDICAENGVAPNSLMCPICDHWCDYTRLSSSCLYSKVAYIFDNISTVAFSVLMSIGATFFVEGWKRYNADVAWRLGLLDTGSHEEGMRLAYLLQSLRSGSVPGPFDHKHEPTVIPLRERLPRIFASGVGVLFFLCLILAAVVGTIVYRLVMLQVLYRVDSMRPFASIFTAITTAVLNLVVILIMSYFYSFLALKLTDWEYPRTQSEFETSYTVKVFLFQFINYYASIFYVAFFKGNFSGIPGRKWFGLRPEDCDPSGCMVELVILLATIMFGKTIYNSAIEFFNPVILTFFRGLTLKIPESRSRRFEIMRRRQKKEMIASTKKVPRWEWDYALTPIYDQFLFNEYLDVVIQFGFVTLFVTAFPLAPVFALINSLLEVRVDAYNFVVAMRRPLPERARDLGVWLKIIDAISKTAVLTNAFVIAFTSDFIPRLVYVWHHEDLSGYVNSTLSLFEVKDLNLPYWSRWQNTSACWFRDYRYPPCNLVTNGTACSDNYAATNIWWIILAFRLGFVLVFAHVVLAIKAFISYIIPDMPTRVFIQMQRTRSISIGGVSECTVRTL